MRVIYFLVMCLAVLLAGCRTGRPVQVERSPAVTESPIEESTLAPTPSRAPSGTPTLASPTLTPVSLLPPPLKPTEPPPPSPLPGSLELVSKVHFRPYELVLGLDWSPGGEMLAVAAGEVIHLYETRTWQETHLLRVGAWTSALAFDPHPPSVDGPQLLGLAAKDGTLQIWDARQGQRLAAVEAHRKGANSLAFSPDGAWLASAGNDAMVRLWDLAAFRSGAYAELPPLAEMIGGAFSVPVVRFSPDGRLVASVDIQVIRLRDPASQRLVATLRGDSSIFSIAFSPDGRLLASAEAENTLRLWDLQAGTTMHTWTAAPEQPGRSAPFLWCVAFSLDGRLLAAGGSDGFITLWKVAVGEPLWRVAGHGRAVSALAFSPDGRKLASGGLDATLRLWQVAP